MSKIQSRKAKVAEARRKGGQKGGTTWRETSARLFKKKHAKNPVVVVQSPTPPSVKRGRRPRTEIERETDRMARELEKRRQRREGAEVTSVHRVGEVVATIPRSDETVFYIRQKDGTLKKTVRKKHG